MARLPTLPRLHIWLGWIIAVPLLLWTASGLFMVSFPIDQVRGTDLRATPLSLPANLRPTAPSLTGPAIHGVTLAPRIDRPIWIIRRADDSIAAADAATGSPLPAVNAALASRIADAALQSPVQIASVRRFAADSNPIDLRRDRPAWQVAYTDGLRVYVDVDSGEVLAVRSRLWRAFDTMWGLHIMDLESREDTHHPLLTGFAWFAFASVLLGTVLLFRRRRRPPREQGKDQRQADRQP
jgi:hypothetical protein